MKPEIIEVLKQGTLLGNVFVLPEGQLERKLYTDVAKALQDIGGKWNRKQNGFLFENNPAELIAQAHDGETYAIESIAGNGAFKSSGTLTEAQILILQKP